MDKDVTRFQAPKDGTVIVTVAPTVSEREIFEDRESIIFRLHAAYLNLQDEMAEFQQQWDEGPMLAFINSAVAGANQGGAAWLSDQAELFEKETWIDLGEKIKESAGSTYDRLAIYGQQRYEKLKADVNKHIENPEDTLYNWAWWKTTAQEQVDGQIQKLNAFHAAAASAADSVLNTADRARKIYKHRDAILNLPILIAQGDTRLVQAFVDNELKDIDPELAKAIRESPNFAVVLEIIADHDSALGYLAYVGLALEAVPPNFYAYVAGKGGAYVMIEVVLLLVTALLSAGTAAAARLASLAARFAVTGAKAASARSKLKRAQVAVKAFVRVIEDFSQAVDELHALGEKLLVARSKGLVVKGGTKTTLKAQKASIRREKKCRMCGSSQHSTPRHRIGTVVYR